VSALWRDNPVTPAQQQFAFRPNRKQNKGKRSSVEQPNAQPKTLSQAAILLSLLRKTREAGNPLTLPEILQTGIAQFTARIFELREQGFVIENEMQRAEDGRVLSRYWLRHDPERDGAQ